METMRVLYTIIAELGAFVTLSVCSSPGLASDSLPTPTQPWGKGVNLSQTSKNESPTNLLPNPPTSVEPPIFAPLNPIDGFPKAFIAIGSKESSYAITVEKQHHRLSLLKLWPNHKYEVVKTFRSVTGKNPGNKKSRGDLSTPEGIYFVTGSLHGYGLPKKYGGLALTLDYPNIYDKEMRKTGSGIWLHSTDDPDRLSRPYDSEGCVVLAQEDLFELSKYVRPFEVPVVITQSIHTVQDTKVLSHQNEKAMEMIEGWRQAWETSDFDNYSSFYSQKFESLGKDILGWIKHKSQLAKIRKNTIKVKIDDIQIIAFEDQLLTVFNQSYQSSSKNDLGRKFLYLKWETDRYRIIAEKWYNQESIKSVLRLPKNLVKSQL
jgi:murein L,D-transpeptidase YafK